LAEERVLAVLRSCPPFSALPEEAAERLAARARLERYEPQQALFLVGDPSNVVYAIGTGHVSAVIPSTQGRDLVAHVAGPGEAPGELDLVDGASRSVNAIAQDDVEVVAVPTAAVRAELLANPESLMAHTQNIVGICRSLGEQVRDRVFLDLHGRLAKHLLLLAAGSDTTSLGEGQAAAAARLGVARQSLNRALGDLQRAGAIAVGSAGAEIEIVDGELLERVASRGRFALSPR